jgi:hypothetical protein
LLLDAVVFLGFYALFIWRSGVPGVGVSDWELVKRGLGLAASPLSWVVARLRGV